MSTTEITLTNSYWEMLRFLSNDIKLRLVGLLTNSILESKDDVKANPSDITSQMIAKFSGALTDDRTADEMIADIEKSRCSKPIQEFSF